MSEFIRTHGEEQVLFVRINDLGSSAALRDLQAIVRRGLTGVVLPKASGANDIGLVSRLLSWLECDAELPNGSISISPILETAQAIHDSYELAKASGRVAYIVGLGARGGDEERSLGYRWSREGRETFMLRSRVILDARAAGVPNPLTGLWTDVADLDGLQRFAEEGRDLGYEGMDVIHPSHVSIVNTVFSADAEEVDYYRGLLEAIEAAKATGTSATRYQGHMVDIAMENYRVIDGG